VASFDEIGKQLLEAAVDDYKTLRGNEGPISGSTLEVTKTSGRGAAVTGVAGAGGAIAAGLANAPTSVVIAAIALAAVATLANALVVRSDHSARAAVTVDIARMVPKLILAAHVSAEPVAAATNGHADALHYVPAPRGMKVKLKGEDTPAELVALRFNGDKSNEATGYLVGRTGHTDLGWRAATEISELADARKNQ
jgi:hypothetical protein